ncbi:hypothetical protein OSTOST_17644, partial [Ostertagia ostertagi]
MPYNYPKTIPEFVMVAMRPDLIVYGWKLCRATTLRALRNACLRKLNENSLLDERGVSLSQVYPAALLNYLNELKTQGKEEFEKTCTTLSVLLQQNMAPCR